MKKITIVIICLILCCIQCFGFNDIDDKNLNAVVEELASFEIINGYEDGSFKPENNITRAEFAKLIICATGYNYYVCETKNAFIDVDASHWGSDYIYIAKRFGIVNGTTETTFEPEANITYEQAIKMIVCSLGYGEVATEQGGYPDGYIQVAKELGILSGLDFVQTATATRKDIALMIYNALDIEYNEMYEFEEDIVVEPSPITLREMHTFRIANSEEKSD